MRSRALGPTALGLLGFVLACAFWLPGLDDAGLWTDAELPVFDRTRAALGDAISGLERSPPLPDLLRTRSFALFGGAWGLRLPHVLAAAGLVGLAIGWTRARGHGVLLSIAAGAFALSFPMTSLGARTVMGNPIAELCIAGAVLSGGAALNPETSRRHRALAGVVAIAGLGFGLASAGIVLGVGLPLAVLAATSTSRRVQLSVGAIAAPCLAVGVALALKQQDGYIPLLAAAKDLELLDAPQARRFAAGLEDFGYQVFPWAGLAMLGAVAAVRSPGDRAPGTWLLVALAITAGWSSVYGATPIPLTVPAAACCTLGLARFVDPDQAPWERRVSIFLIAAAALLMAKDGALAPNRLVAPTALRANEHTFPGEALNAETHLKTMGKAAFLAVVVGGVLGRRRREWGLERLAARVPARDALVVTSFAAAAVASAATHAHVLLPRTAELFSPKRPLQRLATWADAGVLPPTLGTHRIRDRGLALYGPDALEDLPGRRDLVDWFAGGDPAVALIRDGDYPRLFQAARIAKQPLFMLDDSHARFRLVSNRLPDDAENLDPRTEVVLDQVPALEHETLLRFENYIEIVGWQIDGPIRRGKQHTLQLAIRVLRPLPGGSKLYARMLNGRLSRIGGEAHELAEGLYPCNLWRKGDVILHRWTFDAPPLEIMPGDYDLLIGLRRSATKNFVVTEPEGKEGDFGVVVRGKKREFAKIGTVAVW
ncbi:MAG: hypothetical protein AAGA54_08165 [Myxococcota bacterium]